MLKTNGVQTLIRSAYGKMAETNSSCGCPPSCCDNQVESLAQVAGYTQEELKQIPSSANLGLSCGNPLAATEIHEGEVVLDLGSGAGMDCFLAAHQVGVEGFVYGVDITPEMVEKATRIAKSQKITNVEFKLGAIEELPLPDASIDLVISNCVINLSAEKEKVFEEALRVLKPTGRFSISDMALRKPLPETIQNSPQAYTACIGGAILIEDYRAMLKKVGFKNIELSIKGEQACISELTIDPIGQEVFKSASQKIDLLDHVVSITIKATKN